MKEGPLVQMLDRQRVQQAAAPLFSLLPLFSLPALPLSLLD
jgi:hypothetical protein